MRSLRLIVIQLLASSTDAHKLDGNPGKLMPGRRRAMSHTHLRRISPRLDDSRMRDHLPKLAGVVLEALADAAR